MNSNTLRRLGAALGAEIELVQENLGPIVQVRPRTAARRCYIDVSLIESVLRGRVPGDLDGGGIQDYRLWPHGGVRTADGRLPNTIAREQDSYS